MAENEKTPGALVVAIREFFGFLNTVVRSKVFMLIVIVLAIYFGILNIETLREFAESVKEIF